MVQGRNLRTRARAQIEKELNLIEKLNLPGYFLIVWDIIRIIRFCNERGTCSRFAAVLRVGSSYRNDRRPVEETT
jgi:hypothetical protein